MKLFAILAIPAILASCVGTKASPGHSPEEMSQIFQQAADSSGAKPE